MKFFHAIAGLCCMAGVTACAGTTIEAASAKKITPPIKLQDVNGTKCLVGDKKGVAEYEVDIPEDGEYFIWGKVFGINYNGDSFFIAVDDTPYITWDIPVRKDKKPIWYKAKGRKKNSSGVFKLTKGKHIVKIKSREKGAVLEKLFVGKKTEKPAK